MAKTRAKQFEQMGLLNQILWEEGYTEDRPGQFVAKRNWLETASERDIFDQWLRGQNIAGYADIIANALDSIRKVTRRKAVQP